MTTGFGFCANCGTARLAADQKFCAVCGSALAPVAQPAPTQTAPAPVAPTAPVQWPSEPAPVPVVAEAPAEIGPAPAPAFDEASPAPAPEVEAAIPAPPAPEPAAAADAPAAPPPWATFAPSAPEPAPPVVEAAPAPVASPVAPPLAPPAWSAPAWSAPPAAPAAPPAAPPAPSAWSAPPAAPPAPPAPWAGQPAQQYPSGYGAPAAPAAPAAARAGFKITPPMLLIAGVVLAVIVGAFLYMNMNSGSGGITFTPSTISCGKPVAFTTSVRLPSSVKAGDKVTITLDGKTVTSSTVSTVSDIVQQPDGSWTSTSPTTLEMVQQMCAAGGSVGGFNLFTPGIHTMQVLDSTGKVIASGSYTVTP